MNIPMRVLAVALMMLMIVACVVGVLVYGLRTQASPSSQLSADPNKRVVLDNGLTVLLYPVPEADRVAVESFYKVGFLHEPKGITQAAHLLEHLMCQCATQSYHAGESMRLLNQKGMANAETLPAFTHYDYALPVSELELALRIEAERLTSLKITPEVIRQEAPKCYQEAAFVEQNPQAGMFKHAFMAFNQAWRHRMNKAQVRGGLESIPVADLEQFYHNFYRPQNLVLVIVGGFKRDEVLSLVKKHLGGIRSPETIPPKPNIWSQVPKEMTVQWDSKVRAVCIGFPPPDDAKERLILSLWGNLLMQRLIMDQDIQQSADSVFCANQMWSVDALPFFVYATAKSQMSPSRLQRTLTARLQSIAAQKPSDSDIVQLRFMMTQFAQEPDLRWDQIRQQGQLMARQMGLDPKQGASVALMNTAIQLGIRELLIGSQASQHSQTSQPLTADDVHRLLQRTFDPSRQFMTVLIP